ncbi:MAG: winged helix-turn-helix domain-containing protein [Eubacterium sp.]|nr:winged helix-turn-helix domain-containing protein [Candidatus Colimonas fimequi]
MNKVEICLLGRFEINLDGNNILDALGNSKKKTALLQYLLVNKNTQFTNFNLFEHLWGEDDSANPESALKTLVSRLRKDLKPYELSNIVSTRHGVYQWNDSVYDNIDIYRFEDMVNEALEVSALDERTTKLFEDIFIMYKGDLLVGYDTESWIVPRSMHYHDLYLKAAYKYISLLGDEEKYSDILRITRRALEIDQFDTRLNLEIMNAMLALNMKAEAMNHYNYTVNLHYTQLGTRPSEDIVEFYRKLIQVEHSSEATLETVSRELEKEDGDTTAFVCDYSIFKDIYKINMRNLQRLGITVFLGVITLSSTADQPTESELILLDKVMGMLQATLKFNLRKGDTISRYGPSQFLVLLPTHNHNSGALALERVKNAFYKNCTIPNFVFSYKLTPLGYNGNDTRK